MPTLPTASFLFTLQLFVCSPYPAACAARSPGVHLFPKILSAPGVCTFGIENYAQNADGFENLMLTCSGADRGGTLWVETRHQKAENLRFRAGFHYSVDIGPRAFEDTRLVANRVEERRVDKDKIEVEARMLWDGVTLPRATGCRLSGQPREEQQFYVGRVPVCASGKDDGCRFTFKCEDARGAWRTKPLFQFKPGDEEDAYRWIWRVFTENGLGDFLLEDSFNALLREHGAAAFVERMKGLGIQTVEHFLRSLRLEAVLNPPRFRRRK